MVENIENSFTKHVGQVRVKDFGKKLCIESKLGRSRTIVVLFHHLKVSNTDVDHTPRKAFV